MLILTSKAVQGSAGLETGEHYFMMRMNLLGNIANM